MISYTLKKAEQEGQEDLIVKVGQSHEFKMSDVKTHMIQLDKNVTSLKSQIELESAKMTNIEQHHPEVLDLSDEKLVAVSLFMQAKTAVKQYSDKLVEIEALQKEYGEELKEIESQTGLKME